MEVPRVTGHLLPNYIGKAIILLGKIDRKSSDGRSAEISTTDDVKVNVTLAEPIDGNPEGYVEVQGTLKSKNTLSCNRIHYFKTTNDENFDPEQYADMVNMYNLFAPKIWEGYNVGDKDEEN